MELIEANELLERYYDGETSQEQELALREFLAEYKGSEPALIQARQMFIAFSRTQKETSNLEFERITKPKRILINRWVQWSGALAAAILIPIVLTVWLRTNPQPVVYAYINGKPITNKELALKDTQKALMALSDNMAKGTGPLKQIQILNKPVELLTFKK